MIEQAMMLPATTCMHMYMVTLRLRHFDSVRLSEKFVLYRAPQFWLVKRTKTN